MKVLLIRSLLFISFLAICSGCAIRDYGLKRLDVEENKVVSLIPLFSDTFSTALYKAQVDLYGKYFGGLLFLKNMQDSNYRLIMTTETGLQLFDMELQPETLIVHACMEQLNKAAVLKTIETDFRILLMKGLENQKPEMLKDKENSHTVFKFSNGKKITYYFIENKTGYLDRIERASPWFKKISVRLQTGDIGFANYIEFCHHHAKLQIRLRLLKNS